MTQPLVAEPTFQHGYTGWVRHKCRCNICRTARTEYIQNRRQQIAAGTWHPFLDVEPVRDHLNALFAANIGFRRVAELTGVSVNVLDGIRGTGRGGRPPTARVRQYVADRILAVEVPDPQTAKAPAPPVGTSRRIRAWCCNGWPLAYQAELLGVPLDTYTPLADEREAPADVAAKVAALYDARPGVPGTGLSMTLAPAGSASTQVREHAFKHCWFGPLAWDDEDLDNPDAFPKVLPPLDGEEPHPHELMIQHVAAGHNVERPDCVLEEMVRRCAAAGYTAAEAAALARTTPKTITSYRIALGLTGIKPQTAITRRINGRAASVGRSDWHGIDN